MRLRQIRDVISEKIERHIDEKYGHLVLHNAKEGIPMPSSAELLDNCWSTIKLNYIMGTKNRAYTEEEDAFLLCMMHRHGFGSNERIRLEIRRAWQFRFDWYFKSRSRWVYQSCFLLLFSLIYLLLGATQHIHLVLHLFYCYLQSRDSETL